MITGTRYPFRCLLAAFLLGCAHAQGVNGVLNAADYVASDICASINAAYAALPSTGGHIYVPVARYAPCITQIAFTTPGKLALLEAEPGGAVTLSYSGGASPFVLVANNGTNSHASWGDGLQRIKLQGPSASGSVVGLQIGSTSNGVEGFEGDSISIMGFGTGVTWQAPSGSPVSGGNASTWASRFTNSIFQDNGIAWDWELTNSNAGENIECVHCLFGVDSGSIANQVKINGPVEMTFTDSSFDNAQIDVTGAATVNISNGHIEQTYANTSGSSGDLVPVMINNAGANVSISGYFSQDSPTTYPSSLVQINAGHLAMSGIGAASNSGGVMPVLSAWNASWVSFLAPRYLSGVSNPPFRFHSFTGQAVTEDLLGNISTSGGFYANGGTPNTGAALTKDSSGGADLGPAGTITGTNRASCLLNGSFNPSICAFGNGTAWLNSITIDTSGNVSNSTSVLLQSALTGYSSDGLAVGGPTVAEASGRPLDGYALWSGGRLGSTGTGPSGGIPNIQITVGTQTISANSCTSTRTATMTGLATTNTVQFTPTTQVSGVTGWGPSGGGLYFSSAPAANTLDYQICNPTSSSITISASTTWNVSAK